MIRSFVLILCGCFINGVMAMPMPKWLKKKTGLECWPKATAPYVHEPHHNLSAIPSIPPRNFDDCSQIIPGSCSFDCEGCIAPSDISSCSLLSQTFDDGPTRDTSTLLKYLRKHSVKTTFFCIGQNVIEYPFTVKQEKKDGHLIAVHTWSHQFLPALSNEQIFAEMQWGVWAIAAATGQNPRYFRPPYGGIDNRVRAIASQLGLKVVMWDRDTLDWKYELGERSQSEIIREVDNWVNLPSAINQKSPQPCGLILEHDFSAKMVDIAIKIHGRIKNKQLRVDQC